MQLCLRVPDPPGDGGTIAMRAITGSLISAGAKVKILAFNTQKHYVDPEKTDPSFRQSTAVEMVYLDTTVKVLPAFLNLFRKDSYHIQRFISKDFETKLVEILKAGSYDIVQLESLFLAPYVDTIRKHAAARIVLRAHNVEYRIWQQLAYACRNPLKRWYLSHLAAKLRTYEIAMLNRYDAILPITAEDEKLMREDGCRLPACIIPLGLEIGRYQATEMEIPGFSLFHLGSMDWMPNLEAVEWFLKKVWPEVQARDPGISLYLAGKNMPEAIKRRRDAGLIVEDFISDAIRYMSNKAIMIVPLLSGGGMRVKIMEGMALGKTIISTRIGAEGIACKHGENILIADSATEFIHWILECRKNPELCRRIGAAAAHLAASEYNNDIIGKKLYQFYLQILKG